MSEGPGIFSTARRWWEDAVAAAGRPAAARALFAALRDFLRDSTPARLRGRYGDADYDWEHRVNTTSGAVGWRDRLIGVFHSEYQPTDPVLFREMMAALEGRAHLDFRDFTFIDLGSGKGRTLLMASDFNFRRIVGVELLPSLDRIAHDNLRRYHSESQKCFAVESICADAANFTLPAEPLLLYLFNPFPESNLRRFVANLERSLRGRPRPAFVIYHNPLLERVLNESALLRKICGTATYSIFEASSGVEAGSGTERGRNEADSSLRPE